MKYIVTGGAGFIGSNLVDELISRGNEVIIIDNLSTGKIENLNPKAIFYNLDICDIEKIKPLFNGVDYVFHLAGLPRVLLSVKDPAETSKVNILGTINVFKSSAEAGVKKVVFYSSSAVYGNQTKMPIREDAEKKPISPYGLQKLTGELFANLFNELYKLPIISLRFFNVYGPRIDFDSDYGLVIGKFLYLKSQGNPLTIFGDGKQTRGFCYVSDAVNASIAVMENKHIKGGEIINISSQNSSSVNDVAKLISDKINYLPIRPGDPTNTMADISLAKKLLAWEPKVKLEEGIELTNKWLKNYLL